MADHYARSVALLQEADELEAELTALQGRPTWPAHTASDLSRRIRSAVKRAEIHATLAAAQMTAQAIRDADVPLTGTILLNGETV